MSFVILNCMDVDTARVGLQALFATREEVGDMLGEYLYVRVCTTCGTLETKINEGNFRLHSPDHPMAVEFRAIVNTDSVHALWGLAPSEFPACYVIGVIQVRSFRTYGQSRMDCPKCGCSSL